MTKTMKNEWTVNNLINNILMSENSQKEYLKKMYYDSNKCTPTKYWYFKCFKKKKNYLVLGLMNIKH